MGASLGSPLGRPRCFGSLGGLGGPGGRPRGRLLIAGASSLGADDKGKRGEFLTKEIIYLKGVVKSSAPKHVKTKYRRK